MKAKMITRAIQLQNDCKILFALLVCIVSVVPMLTAQNTLSPMSVTRMSEVLKDTMIVGDAKRDEVRITESLRFFECYSSDTAVGWVMVPMDSDDWYSLPFPPIVDGKIISDTSLTLVQRAENIIAKELSYKADTSEYMPAVLLSPLYYSYKRQYVFFVSVVEDTCAAIFYSHHEIAKTERLDRQFRVVFDGGDYYWKAKVNITQNKLIYYDINGPMIIAVPIGDKKRQGY